MKPLFIKTITLLILFIVSFTVNSYSRNTNPKQESHHTIEKEPIIKIKNNNKIITKAQLEKIDPTTIKSIDVYPDTVFIILQNFSESNIKDKKKSQ